MAMNVIFITVNVVLTGTLVFIGTLNLFFAWKGWRRTTDVPHEPMQLEQGAEELLEVDVKFH